MWLWNRIKLKHPDLGDVSQPPSDCLYPGEAWNFCVRPCVLNSPRQGSRFVSESGPTMLGSHREQEWEAEIVATHTSWNSASARSDHERDAEQRQAGGGLYQHGYFQSADSGRLGCRVSDNSRLAVQAACYTLTPAATAGAWAARRRGCKPQTSPV